MSGEWWQLIHDLIEQNDKLSTCVVILEIPLIMFFFIVERKPNNNTWVNLKNIQFHLPSRKCNIQPHTIFTFSQDIVSGIRFTLLPETTKYLNVGEDMEERDYKSTQGNFSGTMNMLITLIVVTILWVFTIVPPYPQLCFLWFHLIVVNSGPKIK